MTDGNHRGDGVGEWFDVSVGGDVGGDGSRILSAGL